MRISDWISDLCSSDLNQFGHGNNALDGHGDGRRRVDDREFEALLPQYLKIGGEARNGSLRKGGIFRLPLIPPISERSLRRSEEHPSELQSLMRSSYAVFCLKKKK